MDLHHKNSKFNSFCNIGKSDSTPKKTARSATVDMAVKYRQSEKENTVRTWRILGKFLLKTALNSGHRIFRMEFEYTKRFVRQNRHYTAMSTVKLITAWRHVSSPKCYSNCLKFSFQLCNFNFSMPFSFC